MPSSKIDQRIQNSIAKGAVDLNLSNIDLSSVRNVAQLVIQIKQELPGLKLLNLTSASFTDEGLGKVAERLTGLTSLNLGWCRQITDEGLGKVAECLPGLASLNLTECDRITDEGLGKVAERLTGLTSLNLGWCRQITDEGFRKVAQAVRAGRMNGLHELKLHGTQVNLPASVINSGNAAEIFRAYWEARQDDARSLDEIKLLLVGQGEVGKTHLRKRLLAGDKSDDKYHNPLEERTPDIEFGRWSGTITRIGDTTSQWRYRVWDFGGQDHLHGTHRFFVGSEHCVYLLLLDATRNARDNRLDYWLRFLAHHGRSSTVDDKGNTLQAPVVIILNKCDAVELAGQKDCPAELEVTNTHKPAAKTVTDNHNDLQRNLALARENNWLGANVVAGPIYGLGRSPQATRHRIGKQIETCHTQALAEIRQAILDTTNHTVGKDLKFAKGFFETKDWLEEQFQPDETGNLTPWLDYHGVAFQEAFDSAKVQDEGTKTDWLKRLRDLGSIHWVGDMPEIARGTETRIKRGVFNPAWVKEPVYKIIQTSQGQHDRGWIRSGALEQRLSSWTQDQRDVIRRLMIACGLACEVQDKTLPDGLLIPDLLESREETRLIDWRQPEVLRTIIQLEFLPERVFLRYVADKYSTIKHRQDNCWRNQLTLAMRGLKVDVEVVVQSHICPGHGEPPRVEIIVKGGGEHDRQAAFVRVHEELNRIFESEGLKVVAVLEVDDRRNEETGAVKASGQIQKASGKRPAKKRGDRAVNIEKLTKVLMDEANKAKEEGCSLPNLKQADLARKAGLPEYHVSRCLNDPSASVLRELWKIFTNPEDRQDNN